VRLFESRGISKNFGAIQALNKVDLKIDAGEVLGLMGDNGAGKSTLIKIMAGNFRPSGGEIWLKGQKVEFYNPVDARNKGVEVVYRDLALCDNLTAAENVFLGREAKFKFGPFSFIRYAAMFREAARWFLGAGGAKRVHAAGTIAIHQGLAECGDVDNGVAICEFGDGQIACFYASRTMAHGHETLSEIIGTHGRLTVGQNPRIDRVEISDAHGVRNQCTPTFYERFAEAFQLEAQAFVDTVRGDRPLPLTLRDATEATRIGIALTQSLRSGQSVKVE
jgi:ABC-type Fe3+/spermidine/putrescine transport system ATPase subunit